MGKKEISVVEVKRLIWRWLLKVDIFMERVGTGKKLIALALIVGVLLMALAAVYVAPRKEFTLLIGRGYELAKLSETPFEFIPGNRMQLRILTPLIAYGVFLRGEHYVWMPIVIGVIFLSVVYGHFRWRGLSNVESLGVASLMAFSIPVSLMLVWVGFTDITSYLLLLLCIVFIRRSAVWPIFYALALLNHEANLFAAPWLVLLANMKDFKMKNCVKSLLLLIAAMAPMAVYRYYVGFYGGSVKYSIQYYSSVKFAMNNLQNVAGYLFIGIIGAFRLFWVLPLLAIYHLWGVVGRRREAAWLILVIVCALAQLLFAHDITRLVGLAFPAVLFGAWEMRRVWGRKLFIKRLWLLIMINVLFLPNFMFSWKYDPLPSLPVVVIYEHLLDFKFRH